MNPALSPTTTGVLPSRRASSCTSVDDVRLGDDGPDHLDELLDRAPG